MTKRLILSMQNLKVKWKEYEWLEAYVTLDSA